MAVFETGDEHRSMGLDLLRKVAKAMGLEKIGIKKMILVLDMDDVTKVYIEHLIPKEAEDEIARAFAEDLAARQGKPLTPEEVEGIKVAMTGGVAIDTSCSQNKRMRTFVPKPVPESER